MAARLPAEVGRWNPDHLPTTMLTSSVADVVRILQEHDPESFGAVTRSVIDEINESCDVTGKKSDHVSIRTICNGALPRCGQLSLWYQSRFQRNRFPRGSPDDDVLFTMFNAVCIHVIQNGCLSDDGALCLIEDSSDLLAGSEVVISRPLTYDMSKGSTQGRVKGIKRCEKDDVGDAPAREHDGLEHARLVEQLKARTQGMSQVKVALAVGFPDKTEVGRWLGSASARLTAATEARNDALVAAYLARLPPAPPVAVAEEMAAEVTAAAEAIADAIAVEDDQPVTTHVLLVQRLEEHMAGHGLSQVQVAKALGLSSSGAVSMWLGRAKSKLTVARDAEVDAGVAKYLGLPPPAPPQPVHSATEKKKEFLLSFATEAAEAVAAEAEERAANHARLVQHLKARTQGMTQVEMASAVGFPHTAAVGRWLGNASVRLTAATEAEYDALVAAYLAKLPPAPSAAGAGAVEVISAAEAIADAVAIEDHQPVEVTAVAEDDEGMAYNDETRPVILRLRIGSGGDGCVVVGAEVATLRHQVLLYMRSRMLSCSSMVKELNAASESSDRLWKHGPIFNGSLLSWWLTESLLDHRERALALSYTACIEARVAEWCQALSRASSRTPDSDDSGGGSSEEENEEEVVVEVVADDEDDEEDEDDDDEDERGDMDCRAEVEAVSCNWPTVQPPPAPPPVCLCATECVWLRGYWWCANEDNGCGFQGGVPPDAQLTPLCRCLRPCKWLLGRWWCERRPLGGCGFEMQPDVHEAPTRVVDIPMRHPPAHSMAVEAARSCAAMLTASAFGVHDWCFVAPSDCGLGLFARSTLCKGQWICEYEGPLLPLETIARGECMQMRQSLSNHWPRLPPTSVWPHSRA